MKKKYIYLIVLFSFSLFGAADEKIDELKKEIEAGGKKAILALPEISKQKRYDLLPLLSNLIRKDDSKTVMAILNFYIDFNDLDKYYSEWKNDVAWVAANTDDTKLILKILELVKIKKENSLLYLTTKYQISNEGVLRRKAYEVIASLKDDRAIPFLLQLANSERPIYKYYFLEAVKYYRDERLDPFIINMVSDESPGIRSKALGTLFKLGMTEKYFVIAQKGLDDPNYDVRKHAIQLIGKNKLKQFIHVLSKSIFDTNPEVREVTVSSIVSLGEKNYSHFLSEQLKKEDVDYLKLMIIASLENLENAGGGQGLIKVLDDDNREVRRRAVEAISYLNVKGASDKIIDVFNRENHLSVRIDFVKSMGSLKDKSFSPTLMKIFDAVNESNEIKMMALDALNRIDDEKVLPRLFDLYEAEKGNELKAKMSDVIRQFLKRHHS